MTWLRDNGLSITLFALFALSVIGHALTGYAAESQELSAHHAAALTLSAYLASGAFISSLFENWESEFLQMAAYVVLTAYLFQRGSPESKDPDQSAPQDRDPALDVAKADAPRPVRAGPLLRGLYSHSLGLTLFLLFIVSFVLHLYGSFEGAAREAFQHGRAPPSMAQHLFSAQFWFESFQNWQSEFLSTAVLIVLSVYLRERGSPESKPVSAPNEQTGNS